MIFFPKTLTSILKSFSKTISDLEKFIDANLDECEDVQDQQYLLRLRKEDLDSERTKAEAVRAKLIKLTSI